MYWNFWKLKKITNGEFLRPPYPKSWKKGRFWRRRRPNFFLLVWLLDHYSNLVQMLLGKILKKIISSKKTDIWPWTRPYGRFQFQDSRSRAPSLERCLAAWWSKSRKQGHFWRVWVPNGLTTKKDFFLARREEYFSERSKKWHVFFPRKFQGFSFDFLLLSGLFCAVLGRFWQ